MADQLSSIVESGQAQRLATGFGFTEGPVWHPDGYIEIRDRQKDIIISGGENISSIEVEETLYRHPAVAMCAVVALPDADKGEKLVAVTNEPGLSLAEVRGAIATAGMTNLCVPRDLRVMDELPKLGTGKLNHREVLKHVELGQAHLA